MNRKTLQVTLNVSESRELIAKGLISTPFFQEALKQHKIILANGTTNAFIYEEILNEEIKDKSKFTAGIITGGAALITDASTRMDPLVMIKGERSNRDWFDVVKEFDKNDLFIKGANSFDIYRRAGIMVAGEGGGTIGKSYGYIVSAGSNLIIPVGMEKLVPSLENVNFLTGKDEIDYSIGTKSGMFIIPDANLFTEIEAFGIVFDVDANVIAAGGLNDSYGSTTFIIKGEKNNVKSCLEYIKLLKKKRA